MDLGLSDNKVTSFRLFQKRIIDQYEKMIPEFNFTVIDGTLPVEVQQRQARLCVKKILAGWKGLPNPTAVHRRQKRVSLDFTNANLDGKK
jgi:dTMP kinase